MLTEKNLSNKRAQIGETMTWIIATIVIIVMLTLTIIISDLSFGKNRSIQTEQQSDVLASKSFFSYVLTKDAEGKNVYSQLQTEENLNDFSGNLAIKIFNSSYSEEYDDLWVGFPELQNNYFGEWTGLVEGERSFKAVQESIKLEEGKTLQLVLIR
jgi:hypothetical protein